MIKMRYLFILALLSLTSIGFSQNGKTPEPRIVGGDVDEHGCRPSAGYQWSVLKNECIQIFNAGIRLDPKSAKLNQTLSAFVVFKADGKDDKVELYLPNEKKSLILTKVKRNEAGAWTNKKYTLTQWKGMYSLEMGKKVLLYQGAAVK